MSLGDAPLRLSAVDPVARGSERRVYLHPLRTDRLLKLLDPRPPRRRFSLRRLSGAFMPSVEIRASRAEQAEQTRAFLRAPPVAGSPPFSRFYGYVETDLGWALSVERITLGNRTLGPTLRELASDGALDQGLVGLLNDLVERIDCWNLRASDLNPKNVVLGEREGGCQFVLVDGVGDIHAVPVRSWSDRLNRLANGHEFGRYAPRLGLRWDDRHRRFAPAH